MTADRFVSQLSFESVVEEVNEAHVGEWTKMIETSDPPIVKISYSAYLDVYKLKKHIIAFNSDKLRNVVGYKLRRPHMTNQVLQEIIDKLKAEHSWPNC